MIYLYIAVMAIVTYLIRAVPLTLVRGKIQNKYIKSFLYYVPYSCLTAMTIPAIFYATNSFLSAIAGLFVAIFLSVFNRSLTIVAIFACLTVFFVELFLSI